MAVDYRTAEARAPVVLVARGRARTWLIGLGAALVALSAIFATQARLTVTCNRSNDPVQTTCHVRQARLIGSAQHDVVLRETRAVALQGDALVAATNTGDVEILRTTLPGEQLEEMRATVESVAKGTGASYAFTHAGGRVIDLQLVLIAFAVAVALQAFAFRKYRVVLDIARREIRAVSYVGVLPWSSRRTRIAQGDRAVVEREGAHTRLVLVRDSTRIVLFDEDGPGRSLEEAATRVTKEIEEA
jgi:hypothetical protein